MKSAEFFKILKEQNLSHLETKVGLSRQALHLAVKTHNMKLNNLKTLAKALNLFLEFSPVLTEENLMKSLVRWGAPLAHSGGGNLSFEACVGESLKRSRQDGVYETILPYVLVQNDKIMDPLKLAAVAFDMNQVNVLGYFVEMANKFRVSNKLKFLLKVLSVAKQPEQEFLVLTTKSNFPELFEKNELALKWNLKVRGKVQDHLQRWEKWEQSQNNN